MVSFIFEEGPKGAAATQVKEEEGGIAVDEALVEDDVERETGTVKVRLTAMSLVVKQYQVVLFVLFLADEGLWCSAGMRKRVSASSDVCEERKSKRNF